MKEDKPMPFLEHLVELRRVFVRIIIALVAGAAICLFFSPRIFQILKHPLQEMLPEGSHFIVTTPFESYYTYFKISFVFGLFLASPVIFYFIWKFIRPGLHPGESKGVFPIALLCSILFTGGALFGYFVVFPTGFQFAVKILHGTGIQFFPKMSDYLSLSLRLLIAFGIIFELPLFLLLLGRFGLVNAPQLRRIRKYIIIVIFLTAGILTPGPDVLSQLLMAIPLLILFEVGIILVKVWGKKTDSTTSSLNTTQF